MQVINGLNGSLTTPEPPALVSDIAPPEFEMQPDIETGQDSMALVGATELTAVARQVAFAGAFSAVAMGNEFEEAAARIDESMQTLELTPDGASAMATGNIATLRAELAPQMETMSGALSGIVASLQPAEVAGEDEAAPEEDTPVEGEGDGLAPLPRGVTPLGVPIVALALRDRVVGSLHPGDRHERRLQSLVAVPEEMDPGALAPVMTYPTFPVPTSLALLATDPEWLLPGIGTFPMNRVELLRPNEEFVESYLAGINHEMMRELLWREYPTDQRGTPFAQFWPRPDSVPDIAPLHTWHDEPEAPQRALGEHMTLDGDQMAVLLVRGDVLRRFPDTVVTAVRATVLGGHFVPDPQGTTADSLFLIRIDESTNAYAFKLPVDELTATPTAEAPGWFFVFQEHSYRMRFGFGQLDPPPAEMPPFDSWDDVAWPGGRVAGEVPMDRMFAFAGTDLARPSGFVQGDPDWNSDATDIARIALQRPFRMAFQSHMLLGGA